MTKFIIHQGRKFKVGSAAADLAIMIEFIELHPDLFRAFMHERVDNGSSEAQRIIHDVKKFVRENFYICQEI